MTGPETTDVSTSEDLLYDEDDLLVEDALVEDVSIDGMCGVY